MVDTKTKAELLRSLPALSRCRPWELELLATRVDAVCFLAGERVWAADPLNREFLILAEGELVAGDGRRIAAGEVVGWEEMAGLAAQARTVHALTSGRALLMGRAHYRAWRSVVAGVPADVGRLSPRPVRLDSAMAAPARPALHPGPGQAKEGGD